MPDLGSTESYRLFLRFGMLAVGRGSCQCGRPWSYSRHDDLGRKLIRMKLEDTKVCHSLGKWYGGPYGTYSVTETTDFLFFVLRRFAAILPKATRNSIHDSASQLLLAAP